MRRRITIHNDTNYRTADLRKLLRAAAAMVFDPEQKPIIRVQVVYARRGNVTGCASLGGTTMTLRIGKGGADVRDVGATMVHEMGHLRGLTHPQMRGAARWTFKGLRSTMDAQTGETFNPYQTWLRAHAWADAFTLHEDSPKRKPRLSGDALIEVRREQTVQSLERWQRKAKRAATAMRKLKARLKYYDRRSAALRLG